MRVISRARSPRRILPALLLIGVVIVLAGRGTGLLTGEFVRHTLSDPVGTLVRRPLESIRLRADAIELRELRVDMKFKHYEKILAKREEALERGILLASSNDLVPAEITFDGRTEKVKMRLKGDWPDQFATDKWSFRVEVKKGGNVMGMRRFSLQHPGTRRYLDEWAFLENLRREGVLAPRYEFVELVFNGEERGIYAVEEHFAKELLEAQGRREGPIAKLEENPLWEQRLISKEAGLDWSALDREKFRSARVGFFGSKRLAENPGLGAQAAAARHLLEGFQRGTLLPSEVFDVETTTRFLALCRLWGCDHGMVWHNMRFYYNPLTARLEPIGFDGEPSDWMLIDMAATHVMRSYGWPSERSWYTWVHEVLSDPTMAAAFLEELHRFTEPAYIDGLVADLEPELGELMTTLRVEWFELASPIPALRRGQSFLHQKLRPHTSLRARLVVAPESVSGSQLELANVADVPIKVSGVRAGDLNWKLDDPVILSSRRPIDPVEWRTIELPAPISPELPIVLTVRTVGGSESRFISAEPVVRGGWDPQVIPSAPPMTELLTRHPFLARVDGSNALRIRSGEWSVDGDLVLPPGMGLDGEPGVTLRMAEDAILVVRGPLRLVGTADAPIRLIPQGASWDGLIVLEAGEESTLEHVHVESTASIERHGWTPTGGVTFYRSPVTLRHCRFENSLGEDALNIIQSRFALTACEFARSASDAFDGDFVEGDVVGCSFHEIGGDALDVSGSVVDIEGLRARNIGDKALSVGEESQARVVEFEASDCGIAIAAKDRSRIELVGGRIRGGRIGLAAYVKKPVFGPAFIFARDLALEGFDYPVLVQEGSLVEWNGERHPGSQLDVEELYRSGVLGN